MKRAGTIVLAAAGLLVALPLLGIATLVIAANTEPGRHMIERLASEFSDGRLEIRGLSGRFPDALRADQVVVSDRDGAWLTIDRARLDWSLLDLLDGKVQVETLTAAHVALARLPKSSAGSSANRGSLLPARIAVNDFHIDRLDLAAPIAGAAASVSVKGDLHLVSAEQGTFALDAECLDSAGSYKLSGTLAPDRITGRMEASEPSHGLLSRILGLPELGPLVISASLDGARNAERMQLSLSAGPLTARGQGTIDLAGRVLNVDLAATAPAMAPRPDLSWQSARLEAHLHGPFATPNATGHLEIKMLRAGGSAVGQFTADVRGNNGMIGIAASLAGLRIPGTRPALFAATPFTLRANVALNRPRRPVTFTLSHPLITATGEVDAKGPLAGSVTVTLPSLAPFAAVAAVDIRGQAALTAKLARHGDTTRIGVDGTLGITGGLSAATALIGDKATLALTGTLQGQDVYLENLAIHGKALRISANGGQKRGVLDLDWKLAVSDLSGLASTVAGTLSAQGRIHGPPQDLAVTAQATAAVAIAGMPKEPLTLSLQAQGLPASPSGTVTVQGRLAGGPLELAAAVSRQGDGTLEFWLDRLQWKSATGQGKLTLAPGAAVPLGHMQFHLARLGDLAPLTGLAATGSINATFDTALVQGKPQALIDADVQHLALKGESIDRLTVEGHIADPVTHPTLALVVGADGIRRNQLTGNIRLTANGPPKSLALRLSSNFLTRQGRAKLSAAATARLPQRDLQLSSVQAEYAGETARLLAPARITFANGVAVDNLRLGVGGAVVALAGRLTPTLALTVSAHNITPAFAQPFVPGLHGTGTIALNGMLRGTLVAPEGTLRLTARRLQITTASVSGLSPVDIDATALLARSTARLNARVTAGDTLDLKLAGTAPLQPAAPIDLRLSGTANLVMLDPLLTPNGRAASGRVTLHLGFAGTMAAPRATGTIRLADGSVQDFVQGVHIADLSGLIRADGDTLRIAQLTGSAGPGTVSITGTIGMLQPEVPVSLTVTARNAQPLASDLLSATLNANLTLRGQLRRMLSVGGEIHVSHADINIPERFPQGVAALNVRRPGAKPAAPSTPKLALALALTIDAPEQIFVRGHGVDAEMGGTLKVGGNATAPAISGGFDLRHGTFSLAGQTLTFTSGRVAFGGSALTDKLDPSINFAAQSTANNVTATLTVTGYADAPKIQLSSSPELPQDEILAHLLFGQSVKQLSPFQLAEIAQAIASLGGVGGTDPLAAVRKGLGLDRLTVSGASGSGVGATAEAGKYIANGVYIGTKQGTSGGTQAQVQIDLTKRLKLESTLGTGGTPATGATPDNDPGSSIGLSYQLEY